MSPSRLIVAVCAAWTAATAATAPAAAQSTGAAAMEKESAMDPMSKDAMKHGEFRGADGHAVAGMFEVVGEGKDRRVRLADDFQADRAPDVFVVLGRGTTATDGDLFLGKLKRFTGASDYAVPADADLAQYAYVVLWSKKQSRAVGLAPLSPPMAGDAMGKDKMGEDAMGKDAMGKDEMGKDAMGKDAMGKDEMGKDAMGKDAMGKDEMGKDAMGKDEMGKDAMGKDEMGKDEMGKDTTMAADSASQ